jgi:hypothetical protein
MYSCYILTEKSKKKLFFLYPPKYPDFIGDHITEKFGIDSEKDNIPKTPKLVEVIGYIDNEDGIEGFLVEINGNSQRPSGGKYHLTWSIDRSKGYKPVSTNDYIDNAININPIRIEVMPHIEV